MYEKLNFKPLIDQNKKPKNVNKQCFQIIVLLFFLRIQ